MDTVQFGRWMSERRRKCGWRSQRSLADAASADATLSAYSITEDFLARLEAGRYAFPFQGSVRGRVLALAWLLCKTPRDVQAYLRASELTDLSIDESQQMNFLREHLVKGASPPPPLLLVSCPRPPQLFGRAAVLRDLLDALCSEDAGICALTGMPGVGKSALAYEAVHQLASNERLQFFTDGILSFTCTGREGLPGLFSLLNDILDGLSQSTVPKETLDLAGLINRTRLALANKRVLLVLDDLEATFPLRMAAHALLLQDRHDDTNHSRSAMNSSSRHAILVTSCYIPDPALMTYHLHVEPLDLTSALELFAKLLGRPISDEERVYAERICSALHGLPLAIEAAASAVSIRGIPPALLAEYVHTNLLDGDGNIRSRLIQALDTLNQQAQQRYTLLSTLGVQSFGLESVAAIQMNATDFALAPVAQISPSPAPSSCRAIGHNEAALDHDALIPLDQLAHTAAQMGDLVRHSLLELVSPASIAANSGQTKSSARNYPRYKVHPLLHSLMLDRLEQLEPHLLRSVQRNTQSYAMAYLERYQGNKEQIAREREFLFAALHEFWRQEQYAQVERFVVELKHVANRYSAYEESKRLINLGIQASQKAQDLYYHGRFLNHLGGLLYHHGELLQAWRIWQESVAVAEALDDRADLWLMLCNLACIASMRGEDELALHFADTCVKRVQRVDSTGASTIDALTRRAFFSRLAGDVNRAYEDVCAALSLLHTCSSSPEHASLGLEAGVEMARLQGDYACSQEYIEARVALEYDPHFVADLLLDQARFAYQQSMLSETRNLAARVIDSAKHVGASQLLADGVALFALSNQTTRV